MSLIPALLKVARKFPEHIAKVPDAFKARGASDFFNESGTRIEKSFVDTYETIKDPHGKAVAEGWDEARQFEVSDPAGTLRMTRWTTPGSRIYWQDVSDTVKNASNRLFERKFFVTQDHYNVPREITAESRVKQKLNSDEYTIGQLMREEYNKRAQRALGEEQKGGGYLSMMKNRATASLERFAGERTPGLQSWGEFSNEVNDLLRKRVDPKDISDPNLSSIVKRMREWNAEYRTMLETSFNGKKPKLKPVNEYTQPELLRMAVEQGYRLPADEIEQAKLANLMRKNEDDFRSTHYPVVFDKGRVRADQLGVYNKIYDYYYKRANLKFRDPNNREIAGIRQRIDIAKIELKELTEKTLTKEPGVNATAEQKGAFTRAQNDLTDLTKKIQRMEKKVEKRTKQIMEETPDQFESRKAKAEARYKVISERTVDRIIGSITGYLGERNLVSAKFPSGRKSAPGARSRFAKQRRLTRHDELEKVLREYMVNDPMTVVHKYGQATMPGLVLDEMNFNFGEELLKIRDDFTKKLNETTDPLEKERLGKLRESVEKDFEYQVNRLLHHNAQDPATAGSVWSNRLMKINNLLLMNMVTVASFSDIGRPIMEFGAKRFGKTLVALAKNSEPIQAEKAVYSKIGAATDMVNASTLQSFTDTVFGNGRGNMFDNALNWLNEQQGYATLFNPWQTHMKQAIGLTAADEWIEMGEQLAKGEKVSSELQLLSPRRAGLTDEDLIAFYEQWQGGTKESYDGLRLARVDQWENKAMAKRFSQAMVSTVDFVMTVPSIGTRPLMQDHPLGRALLQYKSFGLTANQSILLSGLQRADAMRMSGYMAMVGMGWLSYMARSAALGRDISDNPSDHLLEGIDRSGVLALGMDLEHILERASNGKIGLTAMLGGTQLSRYQSQDIAGLLMGPTAGTVKNAFAATGGAFDATVGEPGDLTYGDIRAWSRMIPASQHFATNWALRQMEQGMGNFLGVEMPE